MRPLGAGAVEQGSLGGQVEVEGLGVVEDGDVEGGEEGFVQGVEDGVLGEESRGVGGWLKGCFIRQSVGHIWI